MFKIQFCIISIFIIIDKNSAYVIDYDDLQLYDSNEIECKVT
jgi:hypothetical protein